jgi:hypothetical protein
MEDDPASAEPTHSTDTPLVEEVRISVSRATDVY